jgi:hypothetical protein
MMTPPSHCNPFATCWRLGQMPTKRGRRSRQLPKLTVQHGDDARTHSNRTATAASISSRS